MDLNVTLRKSISKYEPFVPISKSLQLVIVICAKRKHVLGTEFGSETNISRIEC